MQFERDIKITITPRRRQIKPKSKIVSLCTKIKNKTAEFETLDLSIPLERRRFERASMKARLKTRRDFYFPVETTL